MRAADGTVIHMADGTTYTVGNASVNVRGATGGGTNWFVTTDGEYLVYMDGKTGVEAARDILASDFHATIIFLTSSTDPFHQKGRSRHRP